MVKPENCASLHTGLVDGEMKISLVAFPFVDIVLMLLALSEWVPWILSIFLSKSFAWYVVGF